MAVTDDITAFAQSIYRVFKGRTYDDITSVDGQDYVAQVIDQTNQLLDELETLTDTNNNLVDWWWTKQRQYEFGTIAAGDDFIAILDTVNNVIKAPRRYVTITVNGVIVSKWKVVAPEQISNAPGATVQLLCAVEGKDLVFSRPFTDDEDGGTVKADVTLLLPRMALDNADILTVVTPKQLLILGVAKNITLPDIVQGGLSPSYVQKYTDLLQSAITRSMSSTESDSVSRESFAGIGGIY